MEKHTPNKMLLCSHALFVVQGGKGAHVVCGGQRLVNNRRNSVDVDMAFGHHEEKSGGSVHPFSRPSLPSFSKASRRSQLTAFRSASSRISLRPFCQWLRPSRSLPIAAI